jgi:hypothetical protein
MQLQKEEKFFLHIIHKYLIIFNKDILIKALI